MKNKILLIMSSIQNGDQDYQEFPYTAFLIDEEKTTGALLESEFESHLEKSTKKTSLPKCELFRRWLIGRGYKEIELDDNVVVF